MQRKTPKVCEALNRVPGMGVVMEALFDERTTYWDGDDKVDLTNKAYLGLLQLEVEAITGRVQKIEESLEGLTTRRGWILLVRAKGSLIYQSPTSELAAVPLELADVLAHGGAFEGEVKTHGKYLRFFVGKDVLADIPRSLVLQLHGSEETEGEHAEGGGEG